SEMGRDDRFRVGCWESFYVALLLPAAAQPAWPDPVPLVRPAKPPGNAGPNAGPRSNPPQNSTHDECDGPLMDPVSGEEVPPRHGVSLRGAENGQPRRGPCECGMVCQWGFRTEGGRQICNGPWMCSSCMPMPTMPYVSSGGSGAR
ncbi:unnamed protein product, partial [Cladocopium goreaui]